MPQIKEYREWCKASPLAKAGLIGVALFMMGCPIFGVPNLLVTQVAFSFSVDVNTDAFVLSNSGSGTLEWSIEPGDPPDWLIVEPLSGTLAGGIQIVTMTLDPVAVALLDSGLFPEEFTIISDGGSQLISVTLRAGTGGDLIVDPTELDFGSTLETSSFTITNGGTATLNWEITSIIPEDDWLGIAPGSPTADSLAFGSQVIEVEVDRTGLDPGDFEGTIEISSDGGDATITVTMVVAEPMPVLEVTPGLLDFETEDEDIQNIGIRNVGTGTLNWEIINDFPAWLTVNTFTGSSSDDTDVVQVTVDATVVAPGVFTHTITVISEDEDQVDTGTETVDVTLTVPVPVPILLVTPETFDLGTTGNEDFFRIQNVGTGTLGFSVVSNVPWITLIAGTPNLNGEVTTETAFVDFSIDRSALGAGPEVGTISVTSNGGNTLVTVTIEVLPPTLNVVPTTLDFSTNLSQKLVAIFNSGAGSVTWNIDTADFPDWLRDDANVPLVSLTNGIVSGEATDGVFVGVNRAGQSPGSFTFTFTVSSDAGSIDVTIFMQVSETPVLGVDTDESDGIPNIDVNNIPFVPVGTGVMATFTITNLGTGTLTFEIQDPVLADDSPNTDWVTLSPLGPLALDAGQSETIEVTVDTEGLPAGGLRNTFIIISNDTNNPAQPLRVEALVPKRPIIFVAPNAVDLGTTRTADIFAVANFGDEGTILDFGISSEKPWVFFFPDLGRSIGVANPALNANFVFVNVVVDRTQLDGETGGVSLITVFAKNPDGERDDTIAEPMTVTVTVEAPDVFVEAAQARLRVPSLVRHIMIMRDKRFHPIPIPNNLLAEINGRLPDAVASFNVTEDSLPLELTETNQFVTQQENLRTKIVIVLDYSGSAFESAVMAQTHHETLVALGEAEEDLDFINPADPLFDDPLQFIYEKCITSLLSELPENFQIALQQFHDRNQGGDAITGFPTTVIDFTPNDPLTGRPALLAALRGIAITDHGASQVTLAILRANTLLADEASPPPSPDRVFPAIPFDDSDIRGIIFFSDGRLTEDFGGITATADTLKDTVTRLFSVAWGTELNAGPISLMSSVSGGHLYLTRSIDTRTAGLNEPPIVTPTLDQLFDWCNNAVGTSPLEDCDLSISQDLLSHVVLSYPTLRGAPIIRTSVAPILDAERVSTFLDCPLVDVGFISGDLTQDLPLGDVLGFDAVGLGVNLGQLSLETTGIFTDGLRKAEVTVMLDYAPRDLVEISFTLDTNDSNPAFITGADFGPVTEAEGGAFKSNWTLTQPGGPNSFTIRTASIDDPIPYGTFGALLIFEINVPAALSFNVNLASVTSITQSEADTIPGNDEFRVFTWPDAILVEESRILKASAFPTPELSFSLFDFGTALDEIDFTIHNIGGATHDAPFVFDIFLDWEILDAGDLSFIADFAPLVSTQDFTTVTVMLDRDRDVGPIRRPRNLFPQAFGDLEALLTYNTGIFGVSGGIRVAAFGFILPPILTVSTNSLDFSNDLTSLDLIITNTGQSTLIWNVVDPDDLPPWLGIALTGAVPQSDQDGSTILVSVNRSEMIPGPPDFPLSDSTFGFTILIQGEQTDGVFVGLEPITVTGTVDPVANDDAFTVAIDSTDNILNVLSNDEESPQLDVEIILVGSPDSGGMATINAAKDRIIYTPLAAFAGDETFTYTIKNVDPLGEGANFPGQDIATVVVTVE